MTITITGDRMVVSQGDLETVKKIADTMRVLGVKGVVVQDDGDKILVHLNNNSKIEILLEKEKK